MSGHVAAGTWLGTLTDTSAGTGTLRLVLQYSPSLQTISGTWTVDLPGAPAIQGTMNGGSLFEPVPEVLTCEGRPSAGLMELHTSTSRLQGTYSFFFDNCSVLTSGSLDLAKQ